MSKKRIYDNNDRFLTMDRDDEDVDLGLALGSTNYQSQTKLNHSSGAGVNANLKVDMAFAASDPLSELVWSPHKGLSLKCANSSPADKKQFLLWNVGPSSKVHSPSQSIKTNGTGDNVAIDGLLTLSQPMLNADSNNESNGEKEEGACIPSFIQKEESCKEKGQMEEGASIPRSTCGSQDTKIEHNARGGDSMGLGVAAHSEPHATKFFKDIDVQSIMDPYDEVTSTNGGTDKNKGKILCSMLVPPMENLESSAENELCNLTAKEAHSLGETRLPRENSLPVERSPMNNGICLYQEKGKEKALSDGDIYVRSSNNDDDSNESVESCNSVGLFSRGIKRQNYDQELISGSKRIKSQTQGSHGSTSFIKPDSSFMNWISNMVKGLSDSYKEESSSLGLTLACSNDINKNNQKIFMCNKTHDSPCLSTGFQTMFQSLYCRDMKMPDIGAAKENAPMQESKELLVAEKTSARSPSKTCHINNDNSCKQIVVSNKEVNPSTSTNIVCQSSKQWLFSEDFACTPYACDTNLAENKALDIMACDKVKSGVSPPNSLCKQVDSTAENLPLAMSNMPGKSNHLSSLWITRLYNRGPGLENCNQIGQEAVECSTECPKVILDCQINDIFSVDRRSSESRGNSNEDEVCSSAKETHRFVTNPEVSADIKSTHKLKPMLGSPELRSSEAMASVFARRLDALRHIMPSKQEKKLTFIMACFFCGKKGHDLRECPEVTETELEDLLVRINANDRIEESCLCIRCYQFDHWAISCPLASSSRHLPSNQQNVSSINDDTAGHLQLCAGNKPCLDSLSDYLTWNANESSGKRISNSEKNRKSIASHLENELKENRNKSFPLLSFVTAQNIDAPIEIFRAIRKLRLSRVDILRWMNSHVSLTHLNGFFLRLRLGKLESGLGGTGYYVACITGDTQENIGSRSKKSIFVDVGGIKSSVGSQYVSNHDFLEEEIKAWWCRILNAGCKIPSIDELNSKFKDRTSLGF